MLAPCFLLLLALAVVFRQTAAVLPQPMIQTLPGFPGKLPFKLQTGYIGVGESEEIQLFYYFVQSESNPSNDPLFLWLTGGPGCSGLSAFFYEIGPLHVDYANSTGDIPSLVLNPYSWTKVANIIFIDQPAGTGFSYAKNRDAYKCNDTLSADLTYDFLKKWLVNHPEFLKNPLFIAGGSYGGIIVTLVVDRVFNGIEAGTEPRMNLKGYIIGNGFTYMHGESGEVNGRVPYAHRMGLLSDELYMSAKENCKGDYLVIDPDNDLCKNDMESVNKCLDKLDICHILEPSCDISGNGNGNGNERRGSLLHPMALHDEIGRRILQSAPPLGDEPSWCRSMNYPYSTKWANNELVRKALHIREGTVTEWTRCNDTMRINDYTNDVNSVVDYHKKFSHKDCRALIYSGDHDMAVPHTGTEEWIRSLKLQIQSKWRPWLVEGQIAGYTTTYSHSEHELTYATVKGAGHTPAEYKPLQCLPMVQRWLNHNPI